MEQKILRTQNVRWYHNCKEKNYKAKKYLFKNKDTKCFQYKEFDDDKSIAQSKQISSRSIDERLR